MKKYFYLFLLLTLFTSTGCETVKAYQRAYLNDSEMEASKRGVETIETSFQLYREGAAGANGTSAGGGCGCN